MLNFARRLGGSGIGQALVEAKREYILNQAILDPVHEKILMEAVFYGLPMWQLAAPVPAPPGGIAVSLTEGSQAGLTVRDVQVEVDLPVRTRVNVAGRGSYFALDGQTQAALFRAVQPQASLDVGGVANQVAHGALFLGGTYADVGNFDPVVTVPEWTRTIPEAQFLYEGWDPARFWSLAQLERADGAFDEQLVLVPGQFLTDKSATGPTGPTIGTERLYNQLELRVFYAPEAAEFQLPVVQDVDVQVSNNPGIFFSVLVGDPPDAQARSSGIIRVVVVQTLAAGGTGTWENLDLSFNSVTGRWEGTLQVGADIEFFIQAVDGSGTVGMFTGNAYFKPISLGISGPSVVRQGESASFTASLPITLTDPGILWDFGDGAFAVGSSSVNHVYHQEEPVTVTVRTVDAEGHLGQASMVVAVVPPNTRFLAIDIKPGSDTNPINIKSQVNLPVAILSSSDFDAPAQVDRETLTFGRTGDEDSIHRRGGKRVPNCSVQDVNLDSLNDLVCHFRTQATQFRPGDRAGILKGRTFNGTPIAGSDAVRIVE